MINLFVDIETKDSIVKKLNKINKWEKAYKSKIMCKYYIDIDTRFYGKLTEYNRIFIISYSVFNFSR
jgi:hypothetical protein